MAEETKVEQSEQNSTEKSETEEVKPAEQSTENSAQLAIDFTDFEKSIERYTGQKIEPKSKSQEETTAGEKPASEETGEEKKIEAVTDEEKKLSYEPVKIKWNGEEKDLYETIKSNPDLIHELERRFDYTQKTQALKTDRETFETEKDKVIQQTQLVQLDNLALIAGGVRKKPYLDQTDEADDETKQKYDVYTDINEFRSANEGYDEWLNVVNRVETNRRYAETENQKLVEDFKGKYQDTDVNELISKFTPYLNYAVAKGQQPLPKDAFELMHKAFYFDKLVADKTKEKDELIAKLEIEKKAEYKKGYDEALKDTQGKAKPKQPSQVKVPTKVEGDNVFSEYENSINRYTRSY